MFRTIFRISIAVPLVCCSSASNDHQSLLMGIWVSDKAVTLREAKKEGQNLPEWIREKLGKSSVVINRRKMSSSELSAPPHERTWLKWSVTSETEDFVYISGAIQRYNKNLGCLEQRWNIGMIDEPDHPDNFSYSHFYCKQSEIHLDE